jgi:hypothetical protein
MALLLQCLRDLRTKSGDFDLLPPPAQGAYDRLGHLPHNLSELRDALSRSGCDEVCGLLWPNYTKPIAGASPSWFTSRQRASSRK